MKYPWLLFDADNTLFNFTLSSKMAFAKIVESQGIPFSNTLYKLYKKENAKVWHEFEEGKIDALELRPKRFRLFLEAAQIEGDASHWNKRYLEELINYALLLDGAEALLQRLHGKYKMAIITNGLQEVQRPRFDKVDLGKYFETIVVSDEIGVAKPHAAFFEYTFKQIGQPSKEDVLVIGDSINSDIRGGNNFGLATCWYNPNGIINKNPVKPRYEIHQLDQLLEIV